MKRITLIIGLFVCFAGAMSAQSFDPAQIMIDKMAEYDVTLDAAQKTAIADLASTYVLPNYPNGGNARTNEDFKKVVRKFNDEVQANVLTSEQRDAYQEARRIKKGR